MKAARSSAAAFFCTENGPCFVYFFGVYGGKAEEFPFPYASFLFVWYNKRVCVRITDLDQFSRSCGREEIFHRKEE